MEINASAVYDKKAIIEYSKQSIKRLKPLYILLFILIGFLFAIYLYDIIALNYPITVLFVPVCILLLFILYAFVFLPRFNYKLQKTKTDAINEYTFYDTRFTVVSTAGGITGTNEVEYTAINRVLETKDYIYIYIAKAKAMIVDKSTINGGTVEEIRKAIAWQIGTNKYKIK